MIFIACIFLCESNLFAGIFAAVGAIKVATPFYGDIYIYNLMIFVFVLTKLLALNNAAMFNYPQHEKEGNQISVKIWQ